jgi:hypothetical protein
MGLLTARLARRSEGGLTATAPLWASISARTPAESRKLTPLRSTSTVFGVGGRNTVANSLTRIGLPTSSISPEAVLRATVSSKSLLATLSE